ncbi:hypothetical protein M3484_05085 [Pseudomonas sp. GX19020]|uniref:hypothetical protein n=1 Tax=Pseudomonas sp. GX19020 TaxID=2942277 RepID=UPI0020190E8A|nr:hypothetical protein [Pseudomonas sp. GX19020]MCL4065936.1 hypothetical protein [Pseudomonas sp. GX19020]
MALIIIDPQFVPDLETRLSGLGIQTDPNAVVLGGTRSVFDFIGHYGPDAFAQNALVPGFIVGQQQGNMPNIANPYSNVHANKGLLRDEANKSFTFTPRLGNNVPDIAAVAASPWNLRSYGDGASVIMEHWLTITDAGMGGTEQDANLIGFGHQNGIWMQWGLTVNQVTNAIRFRVHGATETGAATQEVSLAGLRNIPLQLVIVIKRDTPTSNTFTARLYVNKVLRATLANRSYPHTNPQEGPVSGTIFPGYMTISGGFGSSVRGKYHRSSVTQIPQNWTDAQVLSFITERYDEIQPLLAA